MAHSTASPSVQEREDELTGELQTDSSSTTYAQVGRKSFRLEAKILIPVRTTTLWVPTGKSVETALIRTHAHHRIGFGPVVVLDLKSAYQSVLRNKLMSRLRRRLTENLCNQIEVMLAQNTLLTVGDESNLVLTTARGVPQGSPLSPLLFNVNLYIDELIERAERSGTLPTAGLTFFADNVVCFSKDRIGLQSLLNFYDDSADCNGMVWSVNKCSAILSPNKESLPY